MKSIALVCAHNGESYIFAQLSSMACQSRPISRIVVFDFNSADRTVEEVERFMEMHEAVSLQLVQKDFALGPCHSFLIAMRELEDGVDDECLVYLCDQDDFWLPDKNEKITSLAVELASTTPRYLIHHDVRVTDENLVTTRESFYDAKFRSMLSRQGACISLSFNTTIGHTIAISPDLLRMMNAFRFESGLIMHDWALSVLAELVGKRVFVPLQLSLYRQHPGNIVGYNKLRRKRPIDKAKNLVHLARKIAIQGMLVFDQVASRPNSPFAGQSSIPRVRGAGWLAHQCIRNVMFAPDARRRIAGLLVICWHCIILVGRATRR